MTAAAQSTRRTCPSSLLRRRSALRKSHPESTLEQRDRPRHGRSRMPEAAGGRSERAAIHRGYESPHRIDPVHCCSFCNQPLQEAGILSPSTAHYIGEAPHVVH
jgi:hypothetical protein